ncbi:hypothetical protein AAE478_000165 [Parahypoxylon ruwenzoriense]
MKLQSLGFAAWETAKTFDPGLKIRLRHPALFQSSLISLASCRQPFLAPVSFQHCLVVRHPEYLTTNGEVEHAHLVPGHNVKKRYVVSRGRTGSGTDAHPGKRHQMKQPTGKTAFSFVVSFGLRSRSLSAHNPYALPFSSGHCCADSFIL